MTIHVLVLLSLPRKGDLGMAYVYEYVLLSWHVGMAALRNLKFRTRLYIMGSLLVRHIGAFGNYTMFRLIGQQCT